MIHALVVAADGDDRTFKVECPGVTDYCQTWEECGTDNGCDSAKLTAIAEDGDDQPMLHGKRHRHLGAWMAETPSCFLVNHRDLRDAASDLWYGETAPIGRFPIEIEYDQDDDATDLRLLLAEQPDGISSGERGSPDPVKAAERVRAYVEAAGDGVYDMIGCSPLYARDLDVLARVALGLN